MIFRILFLIPLTFDFSFSGWRIINDSARRVYYEWNRINVGDGKMSTKTNQKVKFLILQPNPWNNIARTLCGSFSEKINPQHWRHLACTHVLNTYIHFRKMGRVKKNRYRPKRESHLKKNKVVNIYKIDLQTDCGWGIINANIFKS